MPGRPYKGLCHAKPGGCSEPPNPTVLPVAEPASDDVQPHTTQANLVSPEVPTEVCGVGQLEIGLHTEGTMTSEEQASSGFLPQALLFLSVSLGKKLPSLHPPLGIAGCDCPAGGVLGPR